MSVQQVAVEVTIQTVYTAQSIESDVDPVSCPQIHDGVYCRCVVDGAGIKQISSQTNIITNSPTNPPKQIKISIIVILSQSSGEEVETSDRSCKDGRHRVEPGSKAGDVIWEDERTG